MAQAEVADEQAQQQYRTQHDDPGKIHAQDMIVGVRGEILGFLSSLVRIIFSS